MWLALFLVLLFALLAIAFTAGQERKHRRRAEREEAFWRGVRERYRR